eukprot:m.95974 g.95974  ORF g.95974 m.95974 type:complete len:1226 (+) comp10134_c0_seq1:244-3921(+)
MEPLQVPLLLKRARGLVKIHGLTPDTDASHKQVWSALTEGRPDTGIPLQYELTPETADIFPDRKSKKKDDRRNSVATEEDFIPEGIVKENWVHKHKEQIPSVVVIFFNLEWQAENWATRESECADLINGIRANAKGRYTRLVAVLLQASPLPDGDTLVEERAVSLRNACQLKTRSSLFALPSKDSGLKGMVIRLESAFFELSVKYYEQAEMSVKNRIEAHATETVLAARYLFKCGYFCELRQQRQSALKSYTQMYTMLRDAQGTGVPLAEIKGVAGLVLAKICQLHFAAQKPKDALTTFREHMKVFASREGRKATVFRHYAWLAEQQFLFAHVFEEAVDAGLAATYVEHPGHYYFRAAEQVQRWKDAGADALAGLPEAQAAAEAKAETPEYIGQTNIVLSNVDDAVLSELSPSDLELVKLAVLEKTYPHSVTIVDMCDKAIVRFSDLRVGKRKVSSRRSLCMIHAVRAGELVELGRHREALDGVVPAINQFRIDKWFELLGHTVEFAARASYVMRDAHTLVLCLLEMSSTGAACLAEPIRTWAHSSLTAVLSGKPPAAPEGTDAADEEWAKHLGATDTALELDMGDFRHALDCKVCVERESIPADEDVCIYLLFHSTLQGSIRIHDLDASFAGEDTGGKPKLKFDAEVEKNGIELVPNVTTIVKVTVLPCDTIAETVSCVAVAASMGEGSHAFRMQWSTDWLADAIVPALLYHDHMFCVESAEKVPWSSIPTVREAIVTKLASRVAISLEHMRPALVGERYNLAIRLTSEEPVEMTDVRLKLSVLENNEPCKVLVGDGKDGDKGAKGVSETEWELDPLPVGGSAVRTQVLKFDKVCGVDLVVELTYNTKTTTSTGVEQAWEHARELHEVLQATRPITCTASLDTLQMDPLPTKRTPAGGAPPLLRDEPVLIKLSLTSNVPWPLYIASITLHDKKKPSSVATNTHPRLESVEGLEAAAGLVLYPAEELTATACMGTAGTRADEVSLGYASVQLRRAEGGGDDTSTTMCPLPIVPIASPPVSVHSRAAAVGRLRQPLRVTYTLKNHSRVPQDVVFEVEKSRLMIFSGYQKVSMKILPGAADANGDITPSEKVIEYMAFPLEAGYIPLPRAQVTVGPLDKGEKITLVHGPSMTFIKGVNIDKPVPPAIPPVTPPASPKVKNDSIGDDNPVGESDANADTDTTQGEAGPGESKPTKEQSDAQVEAEAEADATVEEAIEAEEKDISEEGQ